MYKNSYSKGVLTLSHAENPGIMIKYQKNYIKRRVNQENHMLWYQYSKIFDREFNNSL